MYINQHSSNVIQFNFVQQCIQICTRINSTSVHTYIPHLFYIASSIRMFILIDPIFNRGHNLKTHFQQESIPVGCIPPAFPSSSAYTGKPPSAFQCMLGSQPSVCLEANPTSQCMLGTPLPVHAGKPPPVNRMTHWCKNITFPQTSFAGGKYLQTQPVITIQGKKHHLTFHTETFNCSVIAKTFCLLPKLLMIKGLYSWILCGPQYIFDLLENAD